MLLITTTYLGLFFSLFVKYITDFAAKLQLFFEMTKFFIIFFRFLC
jgi:hypothetical protein